LAPIYPVEFLSDYYITAIESTLASQSASASLGASETASSASVTGSGFFTGTSSASSFSGGATGSGNSGYPYRYSSSGGGLSIAAIDGIAAGVSILGIAILGAIIFFCVRSRKRKRIAAASQPIIPPPPMQQQQQPQFPPKAFDGYQTVPQQEQQQQYPQHAPFEQTQTAYQPSSGAPSALSPHNSGIPNPRFSTANTFLLTPQSPETGGRQSYYKSPFSLRLERWTVR